MSDSVLERSVLERKERDELQLIARAMGASPTSRARKADLVDLILTTAGIISVPGETNGSEPTKPTEPVARRASNARSSTPLVGAPELEEPAPVAGTPGDTLVFEARESSEAGDSSDRALSESSSEDAAPPTDAPAGNSGHETFHRDTLDTDPDPNTTTSADTGSSARANGDATSNGSPPADADSSGTDSSGTDSSGTDGEATDVVVTPAELAGEPSETDQDQGTGASNGNGGARRPNGPRGPGGGDRPRQDRPRNDDADGEPGNRRRRRRGRGDQRPERGDQRPERGEQRPDRERGDQRPDEQWSGEPLACEGLLDLRDDGYGFVRTKGYLAGSDDVYVSVKQTRQFGLRKGDYLVGASRPALRNEKNPALLRIDQVNGRDPEEMKSRPRFESLTPLFPDAKLRLETPGDPSNMTARIIDLIAPIGKGQRGLIVSPPKAGKTTIMKQIVKSIEANNPDVHLMVLLVDERPEEVTDMRRSTHGEVIASTFDRPADEHTAVAELTIERAKRLVEDGRDVVIVLDGITRLARAYNLAAPATGRIMSGGIDSGALYPPKKFFGSARNIEEGGSLTILATALIETGSKMDEVIFEEFKGTGNMELRLDRRLAERRIYPAIDVDASSTRHEELLFDRKQLQQVWRVRRALNALSSEGASPSAALERLMDGMKTFASNDEFLAEAAKV
ncbi:MAG: transcription termination factor Rho [Actinobacteria bacterium]|nr:transcription termination factor Rho [Actinomycetota bacterium]